MLSKFKKDIRRLLYFPSPVNVNIFWNIGVVMTAIYFIQILSGVFVLTGWAVNMSNPVDSKVRISNEIGQMWIAVKTHSVLGSVLWYYMFIHFIRSLFFSTNSSLRLWMSGVFLSMSLILSSYFGYNLAGGVMSELGLSIGLQIGKKLIGEEISSSIFFEDRLGISVNTISKMLTWHIVISLISGFFFFKHIKFLHLEGSSNPLRSDLDNQRFIFIRLIFDLDTVLQQLVFIFLSIFSNYLINTGEAFIVSEGRIPEKVQLYSYVIMLLIVVKQIGSVDIGVLLSIFIVFFMLFYKVVSSDLLGLSIWKTFTSYYVLFFISVISVMSVSHISFIGSSYFVSFILYFYSFSIVFNFYSVSHFISDESILTRKTVIINMSYPEKEFKISFKFHYKTLKTSSLLFI